MPIPGVPSSSGTGFGTPTAIGLGPFITLADIEQETAPRCGPYYRWAQSSITPATSSIAYFDELMSSIAAEDVSNLFVLRRGQMADGSTVVVAAGDRQRRVVDKDATNGGVTIDRAWLTTPPVAGEYVEFHHLDPTQQLRIAVRAGLRRCYFEDRVAITLTGAAAERNLTTSIGWVTRRNQVRRVQFSTTSTTTLPQDQDWWNAIEKGGNVWLAGFRDAYPNTLQVTALRPHFTWVNGADSTTGPIFDTDLLSVELMYAAAAGHIEAWRRYPAIMRLAAEAGYQASQAEAATEFSRYAASNIRRKPREWTLSAPFAVTSVQTG